MLERGSRRWGTSGDAIATTVMASCGSPHPAVVALRYAEDTLWALDQTRLPWEEVELALHDADEVAAALRRLSIRGAPLIGVAAGYAMGRHGADLLAGAERRPRRILTHCNTGALAAPGHGTGLAVITELADRGELELVLACESRPLLQGARLTVWELGKLGIEHELVVDGAAAGLIASREVDAVIVGCDRVAANGDVANKVGTYAHALAAAAAGIPFVVVGPCSTIDPNCPSGAQIEIEQRDPDEVRGVLSGADGARFDVTVPGTRVRNPAFDVTPAALVTALVTERGVASPVDARSVGTLL